MVEATGCCPPCPRKTSIVRITIIFPPGARSRMSGDNVAPGETFKLMRGRLIVSRNAPFTLSVPLWSRGHD
jgi:hypothetical protein